MTGEPLFLIARLHAHDEARAELEQALRELAAPTRLEPGCLGFHPYRSLRDDRLFFTHSLWRDGDAFETHAGFDHSLRFVQRIERLVDQPMQISRLRAIA